MEYIVFLARGRLKIKYNAEHKQNGGISSFSVIKECVLNCVMEQKVRYVGRIEI